MNRKTQPLAGNSNNYPIYLKASLGLLHIQTSKNDLIFLFPIPFLNSILLTIPMLEAMPVKVEVVCVLKNRSHGVLNVAIQPPFAVKGS